MATRGRGRGSRLGNLLVLVGLLVVTGTIFGAGVYTGRHWPGAAGAGDSPVTPKPGNPEHARGDRARAPEAPPAPTLTFYRELTAPLTAPPPVPPKSGRKPAPAAEAVQRETPRGAAPAASEVAPGVSAPTVATLGGRASEIATPAVARNDGEGMPYTVQVGAYRARPPAEALRATLAATGHDARVVETDGSTGARYRVRVGAFATREAARQAAARLASERSLSAFVTNR
jgi:cell division protein FtsN